MWGFIIRKKTTREVFVTVEVKREGRHSLCWWIGATEGWDRTGSLGSLVALRSSWLLLVTENMDSADSVELHTQKTSCKSMLQVPTEGFISIFQQEMVDWFNAIRAARFHYLQVAFPGAGDEEVRLGKRWEANMELFWIRVQLVLRFRLFSSFMGWT